MFNEELLLKLDSLKDLFKVRRNTEEFGLVFVAGRDLCDKAWKKDYGLIELAIRDYWKTFNEEISICIDFRGCEWSDPLPLISLAGTIEDNKVNYSLIKILLPSTTDRSKNKKRFLKYLAQEGFLELLTGKSTYEIKTVKIETDQGITNNSCVECYIGNQKLTNELLFKIKSLSDELAYDGSYCLPAKLITFPIQKASNGKSLKYENVALCQIDTLVEGFIRDKVGLAIANEVPVWAHDGLTYRLHILCRELLHNIVEHAYLGKSHNNKGTAVLYIRFRKGLVGASEGDRRYIEGGIERETYDTKCEAKNSKNMGGSRRGKIEYLDPEYVKSRRGFFEIYILDSGQGLKNSDLSLQTSSGLNSVMSKILRNGFSRKKSRSTKYGGLHLIRELSELTRDYIRIHDDGVWWGNELPLPEASWQNPGIEKGVDSTPEIRVSGVAWTVRFSWDEKTDCFKSKDWKGVSNDVRVNAAKIYRKNEQTSKSSSVLIVDKRIAGTDYKNSVDTNLVDMGLLLPKYGDMKSGIQNEVKQFLSTCSALTCLFIGDIDSVESHAYMAALCQAEMFGQQKYRKLEMIFLCTTSLRFSCLSRNQKEDGNKEWYEVNEELTKSFIQGKVDEKYEFSVYTYIELLRKVDSERLMHALSPDCKDDEAHGLSKAILIRPVKWSKNVRLNSFLDFTQLVSSYFCRQLFMKALSRAVVLFSNNDCILRPVDTLTTSIVDLFNVKQHLPHHAVKEYLDLGSVSVTGLTENNFIISKNSNPTITFFHHPEGEKGGTFLFTWPSVAGEIKKSLDHKRVGDTPAIAKGGWKYYEIPRYGTDGKSLYAHKPSDMYKSIQDYTRPLMKIGHWQYAKHHDLLTINLISAFDSEIDNISLLAGGNLSLYLIKHFFYIFNVKKKHLKKESQTLITRLNENNSDELDSRYYFKYSKKENMPLLVYASHTVTDHIIEVLISHIGDNQKEKDIKQHIFPIVPLKKNRQSSTMHISGLTMEDMLWLVKEKEKKYGSARAVMFDDAIITARTQCEIINILKSIDITEIYQIKIVDRQRLPSSTYMQDQSISCYWRIDVPTLGGSDSCGICRGVERANLFTKSINSLKFRATAHP